MVRQIRITQDQLPGPARGASPRAFTRFLIIALLVPAALFFVLAIAWRFIGFKYIFQFLTSFGLIFLGFYYLFRANVSGSFRKGLLLIVLSPIAYFLGEVLFRVAVPEFQDQPGVVSGFLNSDLDISGFSLKTWHVLLFSTLVV